VLLVEGRSVLEPVDGSLATVVGDEVGIEAVEVASVVADVATTAADVVGSGRTMVTTEHPSPSPGPPGGPPGDLSGSGEAVEVDERRAAMKKSLRIENILMDLCVLCGARSGIERWESMDIQEEELLY